MSHWSCVCCSTVLLGLMVLCQGIISPRASFLTGDPDRAIAHFNQPDVWNTTSLLLSKDEDTLFVGGRNAILALDISEPGVIKMRKRLDWEPTEELLSKCKIMGQNKGDCHNFIRVLQIINSTHMYVCGTFAFSPHCIYINLQTFMFNSEAKPAKGQCPVNPYWRSTAIVVDGELYVGTMGDFMENEPAISRYLSQGGRKNLKLENAPNRLKKPSFIGSTFIPSENKVYYFFNEVSTDLKTYIVSHIAQVCTSDMGGERVLWRQWTTFAKAELVCQSRSLLFSVVQDIATLLPLEGANADETLLYGIFKSQWSLTSEQSAVCIFRLGDIKKVFSGKYRSQNQKTDSFTYSYSSITPGTCGLHSQSDNILNFVKENFVTEASVKSMEKGFILLPNQNYSNIAALRTKAANGSYYTMLFLLTETGFLHKLVLLDKGPHIIEEIQVFMQPQSVKNVLLSIIKNVVFVGSSEGVFQVPVSNCSSYWNCGECVLARDPSCGWDPVQGVCSDVSKNRAGVLQDVENGDAVEACQISSKSKSKSPEQVDVTLNKMVTLRCPKASHFASLHWEREDGHQLHPDTYLQQAGGILRFPALPTTLGHYLCISVENGYKQTLSIVIVMQTGGIAPRSYFREMVAVSVLLAMFLCMLAIGGWLYWLYKQRHPRASSGESEARDRCYQQSSPM